MSVVSRSAPSVSESGAEDAALGWLAGFGWFLDHGPGAALHALGAERGDDVLGERLRAAFARLNPDLPDEAPRDSGRKLIRSEGTTLVPAATPFMAWRWMALWWSTATGAARPGTRAGFRARLRRPAGQRP